MRPWSSRSARSGRMIAPRLGKPIGCRSAESECEAHCESCEGARLVAVVSQEPERQDHKGTRLKGLLA